MANPWLLTNAFLTNPYGFTQALNQEMDRLYSSPLADVAPGGQVGSSNTQSSRGLPTSSGQWNRSANQWAPQIEVRQRGNEITICADLPGMKADDVNIEIEDGVLIISGERQQKSENREEGFYRSERSYGSFVRSIVLPEGVDENEVQARFEDGVLEVTMPVPEQRQRGRKIEVKARERGNSQDQSGSARS
jgi:HSP20 family protein